MDKNSVWYCVMNPIAGKKDYKIVWNEIDKSLTSNNIEHQIYFTNSRKDAEKQVIKKAEEGFVNFIAIGGDGTVHEVVNGIMKQTIRPSEDITLAVIPVGTGNDWAKHHGINYDMDRLCASIKSGTTRNQDVGIASFNRNGVHLTEYFNNVAGMAYDAFVVEELEKRKSKPNKFIYIFSVLSMLFRYKLQEAKVKYGDKEILKRFYTINVGICKYSGGGMSLVPHAIHDDGLLAVTLAGQLNKFEVLLNTYRFYNESLIKHPKIESFQVKNMHVTSIEKEPIYLELDGETAGHNPVEFTIVEKALRFVV